MTEAPAARPQWRSEIMSQVETMANGPPYALDPNPRCQARSISWTRSEQSTPRGRLGPDVHVFVRSFVHGEGREESGPPALLSTRPAPTARR